MSENWDETPDDAAANRFQDQDEARAAGGGMSKNEETRAALSAAVARLGEGYKGGPAWVRCPNRDPTLQPAAPVSAATAAAPISVAAAAAPISTTAAAAPISTTAATAAAAIDENAAMPMNQEETRDALSVAVVKLGKGYQGGRAWPRRPTREPVSSAAAAAVSAGDDMEDNNVAAALRAGFNYRRPGPFRAEDDFAGGRSMGGSSPCMSWRRAWRRLLTVPRTRAATTARTARTRSTPPTPAPAWIQRQSWQQTRWSLCAPKKKICFVYTVFLF